MTNNVVDPEAPERRGVYDPEGTTSSDPAKLKSMESSNNKPTSFSRGNYSFYPGLGINTKSVSASGLSSAESSSKNSANSDVTSKTDQASNGLWRSSGSSNSSNSGVGATLRKTFQGRRGKFLIGGGVGIGVLAILLIMLFIFLSTLLIPGLAEDILTYEFARVERQLSQDTTEDLTESAEIQSAADDASTTAVLDAKFSNDGLFQSLKNLNPDNFLSNLEEQGLLQYNYETISGLKYLKSLQVGNQLIDIPEKSLSDKILHPIQNIQDNIQFANDISSALKDVYPDGGIGVIIRSGGEKAFIDLVDAPTYAYVASKFTGDTQKQADLEEQSEAEQAIDPGYSTDSSLVYTENQEIRQAQKDLESATDSANATTTLDNNGIPPAVQQDINGAASTQGGTSEILSFIDNLNPAYQILLPVCIIYDGSITSPNAATTIQNNSNEDQRTFFYLESAADQQKYGDVNGEAVGALNAKLGNNVGDSVPMERANGQTVNTSSQGIVSPQTAGNGQYTAFNAFLPSLAPILNPFLDSACPVITNPYLAGAAVAAQVAAMFTGDGEAIEAPVIANQGIIKGAVLKAVSSITDIVGATEEGATKATGITSKLLDLFPDKTDVIKIAGLIGLDWVVRIDTAMKSGELNDGLSQGITFADQADAGGNLNANDVMQQQYYGAPLSPTQVAYNNIQNDQFIADSYKKESVYDRYVSPTNPGSLLAKVGIDIDADFNKSYISSFIDSIARIFNPSTLFSTVFGILDPNSKVYADTVATDDSADYGIVQWGYTDQEENLIDSNSSYQPLQNEAILNQYPNQVQDISTTYSPCFTQDMSVLLTSSPSQGDPPGGTTSENYIVRDDNGNVTAGLCTDQYLGPTSAGAGGSCADPNDYDPSDNMCDLVFRWRIQQAYENTADTLTGLANASSGQQD